MVRQLGLEIRSNLLCRGSTNDVSRRVLIFSPVLVEVTFIRGSVQEKLQADLSVQCDQREYYAAEANSQPGPAENGGGDTLDTPPAPQLTITGATPGNHDETSHITVVDLSPTKHRPHDAPYQQQQAVIGLDGMKKLHLHLNRDRQQLEMEQDEVLDEHW